MPENLQFQIDRFHRFTEQATAIGKLFHEAYPAENAELLRAFYEWHQSGCLNGH